MKLTTSIVLFLSLLCAPFAAATGESCYYWDSEKWGNLVGVCGNPTTCVESQWGYWVKDRCPGGSDNRCCIRRSCTAPNGVVGSCTTVARCEKAGGKRVANRCPGPDNVQCCY